MPFLLRLFGVIHLVAGIFVGLRLFTDAQASGDPYRQALCAADAYTAHLDGRPVPDCAGFAGREATFADIALAGGIVFGAATMALVLFALAHLVSAATARRPATSARAAPALDPAPPAAMRSSPWPAVQDAAEKSR